MPFSGTTYTNVSGAITAVPGQTVQSAVWNNIHTDMGEALTQVMSQLVAGVSYKNILAANGGFEIWQQGAGSSSAIAVAAATTAYTADRWYITTGANQASVVSAQAGLSDASQLCARVLRNAGQTGTTAMVFGYPLDTAEIYRMRGNKVSLTGILSAGANWSPANGTLTCALYVGTGAVAKRGAGFTGETTVISLATNLTAGGAAVAISTESAAVVPITSTQAEIQFTWTPVGTAGAADNFNVDDLQIEVQLSDDTWTPTVFDRLPFETQLGLCQSYFIKTFPYAVAPAQTGGLSGSIGVRNGYTAGQFGFFWEYTRSMRATAGITLYNPSAANANWRDVTAAADIVATADPGTTANEKGILISGATATSTAGGINHLIYIHAIASAGI